MNLFTARLTGKMLSTDQFEKSIQDMINRVNRWRQIEKSPELAEYLKLKEIVESAKFQQTKQELSERKYKDTEEGKKMSAFETRPERASPIQRTTHVQHDLSVHVL